MNDYHIEWTKLEQISRDIELGANEAARKLNVQYTKPMILYLQGMLDVLEHIGTNDNSLLSFFTPQYVCTMLTKNTGLKKSDVEEYADTINEAIELIQKESSIFKIIYRKKD
jgi:hypothetical protein